jgi:hypothetical protein
MRYLDYLKRFTYTPNEFYDHLKGLEDAAGGDVDLVILPAMTGDNGDGPAFEPTVTESDGYAFDVTLQIMNKAKTKVLGWYNGTLEAKVDITTSAGTIAIDNGEQGAAGADVTKNMAFENGVCKFTVTMDGTWAADETIKVTVDDSNVGIMGYAVEKNNHYLVKVKANPAAGG